mgnify:CR=1 FL=1
MGSPGVGLRVGRKRAGREIPEALLPVTPDDLVEVIRDYDRQIGGLDDASLQVNFTSVSYDDAEKSIRLFGEKVIPQFAGK